MTEEEKKAIESIKRKITIGECEKNIGIPVYISELEILLNLIQKQENVIDKMAKRIKEDLKLEYGITDRTVEEIKEYFMKEDK